MSAAGRNVSRRIRPSVWMVLLVVWLALPVGAQTGETAPSPTPSPSPSPCESPTASPTSEEEGESPGFSAHISGYLKTDLVADEAPIASRNTFVTSQIPVNGVAYKGSRATTTLYEQPRLLYQESRIRLDVRRRAVDEEEVTPLPIFRDFRFFVEADFQGSGGTPRLRHLYVQTPHLLVGRTDTVFVAGESGPDLLDNEGPNASTKARRDQVRIWTDLNEQFQVAASLEVLDSIITDSGVTPSGDETRLDPDFVAHLRWHDGPSSLQLAGVSRHIYVRDLQGSVQSRQGWGISLGGRIALGRDDLRFQYNFGDGIGSYIQDLVDTRSEVGFIPDGSLETQFAQGGFLAYRHWWDERLRSTFFVSQVEVNVLPIAADSTYRRAGEFGLNLLYDVTPSLTVGAEYLNGYRLNPNGAMGFGQRFQISTRLSF